MQAQETLWPQKPMLTKNKKQTNKSQVLDVILGKEDVKDRINETHTLETCNYW